MQDRDLETVWVAVDPQIDWSYVTNGGKGIQPGDEELSHPGSCIETSGEASEHSSVEMILEVELLPKVGDEFDGIWLPLLPFG